MKKFWCSKCKMNLEGTEIESMVLRSVTTSNGEIVRPYFYIHKSCGGGVNSIALDYLCECGHSYGAHPVVKRFADGESIPPAYSCTECVCKKFELKSEKDRE